MEKGVFGKSGNVFEFHGFLYLAGGLKALKWWCDSGGSDVGGRCVFLRKSRRIRGLLDELQLLHRLELRPCNGHRIDNPLDLPAIQLGVCSQRFVDRPADRD